jgi:spore coat protein U-like protein
MKMTGPAKALLGYGLLLNSAHTNERGRTAGMDTLAGSGNGSSRAQASYSQTAQARYVSSGAFADAITVTVTY